MIEGIIYKIIDPEGFYYWGSTTDFKKRMECHYCNLYTKKTSSKFYNHIRKYEWDMLTKEKYLETVFENRKELYKLEEQYIYDSRNDSYCLNVLNNPGPDEKKCNKIRKWSARKGW